MFTNPFRTPQHKALSDQVRQEWYDFESSWFKAQQSTMERRCAEKFKELDKAFRAATPAVSNTPASKSKKRSTNNNNNAAAAKAATKEHENNKAKVRAEMRKELVFKAREEWQRRLAEKNLQDEDWVEMSPEEQAAVQRTLGGDFGEEGDDNDNEEEQQQAPPLPASTPTTLLSSLLPSSSAVAGPSKTKPSPQSLQLLQTNIPPAPSLSSASRSSNASSASASTSTSAPYAVVNPSSLGKPRVYRDDDDDDDEDEETSPFEDLAFVYDVIHQKPDDRDPYDTTPGSSSFSGSGWSTDLSLSTQTSHTSSPEQSAPRSIPPADPLIPGGWFTAIPGFSSKEKEKENDIASTPTTSNVKGASKSGWGSKTVGKGPQQQQRSGDTSSSAPTSSRSRVSGPYIGPDLNTADDFPFTSSASSSTSHNINNSNISTNNPPSSSTHADLSSEEAEFEAFKMDVRIKKIREFHDEAASADEGLIRDIFRSRKMYKLGLYDEHIDMTDVVGVAGGGGRNGKERGGAGGKNGAGVEEGSAEWIDILRKRREKRCWEAEIRRIEEHEQTMVKLRKVKEDERRVLVEEERKRRREVIRSQHNQQQRISAHELTPKAAHPSAKTGSVLSSKASVLSTNSNTSSSGSSGHGASASLFSPPQQISLEPSTSSFASTFSSFSNPFNTNASSTSLFTPTPASVNPFNTSSQQQPSSSSSSLASNKTYATSNATSLFPEDDEFAFDEAKIASILASQAQMAQKFDGWTSGSGTGSKGGSPKGQDAGATPLPLASTPSASSNSNAPSSSPPNAKATPTSTKAPSPSASQTPADVKKGAEKEKTKEKEKEDVKKSGSTPAPSPAINVTSSSEAEPKNGNPKVSAKAAKKKGKKGQAATPAPAPEPAPPVKEVPAKAVPSKSKPAESVKEVPTTPSSKNTANKLEAKSPAKKDEQPQASGLPSIKSIWGKKEEPVSSTLGKIKKEEISLPTPIPAAVPIAQHQGKAAPTATRWKVSLFDDEPTSVTPGATSSRTTMESMIASSSSNRASNHSLQAPAAQSFWHPPGQNTSGLRSISEQPGGGLKAPEPVSVARAVSDQPPSKMTAQRTAHPEIWLPPQAKQQQQNAGANTNVHAPQPQPWDRKPTNVASARARRMSEPAPPSPVDPAFFSEAAKVQGILKPTKIAATAPGKAKPSSRKNAVVVEEVDDDEEDQDGFGDALSADSRYIMEENPNIAKPKPSLAGKMFNNIFDYDEDDSGSSTTEVPSLSVGGDSGMKDGSGWDTLAKSKAKHVRWTPSAMGNASPISFAGDDDTSSVNIESFLQNAATTLSHGRGGVPQTGRGRTSSISHSSGFKGWGQQAPGYGPERREMGAAVDAKGKGVDKMSSKQDTSEDLSWYAIENLKQMRSKPASAV